MSSPESQYLDLERVFPLEEVATYIADPTAKFNLFVAVPFEHNGLDGLEGLLADHFEAEVDPETESRFITFARSDVLAGMIEACHKKNVQQPEIVVAHLTRDPFRKPRQKVTTERVRVSLVAPVEAGAHKGSFVAQTSRYELNPKHIRGRSRVPVKALARDKVNPQRILPNKSLPEALRLELKSPTPNQSTAPQSAPRTKSVARSVYRDGNFGSRPA